MQSTINSNAESVGSFRVPNLSAIRGAIRSDEYEDISSGSIHDWSTGTAASNASTSATAAVIGIAGPSGTNKKDSTFAEKSQPMDVERNELVSSTERNENNVSGGSGCSQHLFSLSWPSSEPHSLDSATRNVLESILRQIEADEEAVAQRILARGN